MTLPAASPTDQRHPIAVVAERTGLSQDVLRVWERRYEAVRPTRSPNGLRAYSDADIQRLTLLRRATRAGRNIGQIAKLSAHALEVLVAEDRAARETRERTLPAAPYARNVVDSAIALARQLDAAALDDTLRRAAIVMGMPVFLETVAAPLLRKVGDDWHAGRLSPAHEHLVTSSLQEIVIAMMRAFTNRKDAPTMLVTTAGSERHVIGAALVGAAAALEGWNVLLFGYALPAAEVAAAAAAAGARLVAVSIIYVANADETLTELRALREGLPADVSLIAGGAGAKTLTRELAAIGVRVESSVGDVLRELSRSTHSQ
ncbi:MAG: MerR family transcriptional regulator [Gemmatimonadota bacterium]|nr:MerR family transcriptional regulator [Gemmatimonadota bacterium]